MGVQKRCKTLRITLLATLVVFIAGALTTAWSPFESPVQAQRATKRPSGDEKPDERREETRKTEERSPRQPETAPPPKRESPPAPQPRRDETPPPPTRRDEPSPAPARQEEPRPTPQPRREAPPPQPRTEPQPPPARETPPPPPARTERVVAPTPEPAQEAVKPSPSPPAPPPRPQPLPAPLIRDDRTSAEPPDSVFSRGEERRDDPPVYQPVRSPEQRGRDTRDIRGQIRKRDEQRHPDYNFRGYHWPPVIYVYHLPPPPVVVIVPEVVTYRQRETIRYEYYYEPEEDEHEYQGPMQDPLEEALADIRTAWLEKRPEFLMWYVDGEVNIEIFRDEEYCGSLLPEQVHMLVVEAMEQIFTLDFHFVSVTPDLEDGMKAEAYHEYLGRNGLRQIAHPTYHLSIINGLWMITRIDLHNTDYHPFFDCSVFEEILRTPTE